LKLHSPNENRTLFVRWDTLGDTLQEIYEIFFQTKVATIESVSLSSFHYISKVLIYFFGVIKCITFHISATQYRLCVYNFFFKLYRISLLWLKSRIVWSLFRSKEYQKYELATTIRIKINLCIITWELMSKYIWILLCERCMSF
jgi:hypothetical protein